MELIFDGITRTNPKRRFPSANAWAAMKASLKRNLYALFDRRREKYLSILQAKNRAGEHIFAKM